jgi:uncharacterized damage-inducible protein DinB
VRFHACASPMKDGVRHEIVADGARRPQLGPPTPFHPFPEPAMDPAALFPFRVPAVALPALALLLLALPAPARTQAPEPPGLVGARHIHEIARDYLLQTAREATEELNAFRPTDEVRSFGEILGHAGNASYAFCSTALGEASPATSNLEEAPDKATLVAGLEAAFAYCDRAYTEVLPPRLGEEVNLFGMTGSRMWVLIFNAAHNWEHYGNLVTYMRLNGIVPPSSRGGM